jgi:hypothetical protein
MKGRALRTNEGSLAGYLRRKSKRIDRPSRANQREVGIDGDAQERSAKAAGKEQFWPIRPSARWAGKGRVHGAPQEKGGGELLQLPALAYAAGATSFTTTSSMIARMCRLNAWIVPSDCRTCSGVA